jgi:quinate dehydrogenase
MTWLATLAQKFGWSIIDGLDVMEHQAIEQSVLWTERPLQSLPTELANKAIREALRR